MCFGFVTLSGGGEKEEKVFLQYAPGCCRFAWVKWFVVVRNNVFRLFCVGSRSKITEGENRERLAKKSGQSKIRTCKIAFSRAVYFQQEEWLPKQQLKSFCLVIVFLLKLFPHYVIDFLYGMW